MNVHFTFYVQGDCCMKAQNNVFGKSQDYSKTMSRQKNFDKLKVCRKKSLTIKMYRKFESIEMGYPSSRDPLPNPTSCG